MTPPMDPYSVLGVAPSAGADEVKAAYRARARLVHPDFHRDAGGGAPRAAHDAFAQLCSAYQLALGNLDTTRSTISLVDDALGGPVPPSPRVPQDDVTRPPERHLRVVAQPVEGPAAAESFDWRGTVLLLGLAVLGWLFVTAWLPALLEYSTG